jgi:hypothetical protein
MCAPLSKNIRTNSEYYVSYTLTTKAIILLIAITMAIIFVIDSSRYVLGQLNYSSTSSNASDNETNSIASCILEKATKTNGTWVVKSGLDCGESTLILNLSNSK